MPKNSREHAADPAVAARPSRRTGQRGEQVRAVETRAALVAAARTLFGSRGYHETGTNDVVALAQVTRGALYHHFDTKNSLFEAVYREVAIEVEEAAREATRVLEGQTWQRIVAAVNAYLRYVAENRDVQRILLIDGPAVVGWDRWRDFQDEFRLKAWTQALQLLANQGRMVDAPNEPLAHLLVGVLDDAALAVAHASDQSAALKDMSAAVDALISGLLVKKP